MTVSHQRTCTRENLFSVKVSVPIYIYASWVLSCWEFLQYVAGLKSRHLFCSSVDREHLCCCGPIWSAPNNRSSASKGYFQNLYLRTTTSTAGRKKQRRNQFRAVTSKNGMFWARISACAIYNSACHWIHDYCDDKTFPDTTFIYIHYYVRSTSSIYLWYSVRNSDARSRCYVRWLGLGSILYARVAALVLFHACSAWKTHRIATSRQMTHGPDESCWQNREIDRF